MKEGADAFSLPGPPLALSLSHTHTHTHARTHARTHAHTHTHTQPVLHDYASPYKLKYLPR